MKYFIEVLHKKKLISNSNIEHFELKIQTEFTTKAKAETYLNNLPIITNEKNRLHICKHEENKPCELIEL